MARAEKTTTTSWVNIGTGPAVLTVRAIAPASGSALYLNTSATDNTAHVINSYAAFNGQIDFRSGEDIFAKSDVAGWKLILDTDGQ